MAEKKEKLPPYIDSEGNRRDPNRNGHPVLCNGLSRRSGQLCGNIARANGKCRIHGGNATGPRTIEGKKRISEATSKKNFKTGEHAPIWFDKLSMEEQELIDQIPNDAAPLLEQEIKLTTVRERRMLGRLLDLEERLMDGDTSVHVTEHWRGVEQETADGDKIRIVREDGTAFNQKEMEMTGRTVVKEDLMKQIQQQEEALTRVQNHKGKLIELQHKLSEGKIDQSDGSLNQLVAIIGKARKIRLENDTDSTTIVQ